MTTTLEKLRQNRDEIYKIANQYGVSNIRVFGSVARGEDKKNSDVDLLIDIDLKKAKSGFAIFGFERQLKNHFHRDFEITTENALHHLLKKQILNDATSL